MLDEISKRAVSAILLLFVASVASVGCGGPHVEKPMDGATNGAGEIKSDENSVKSTDDVTSATIADDAEQRDKSITLLPVPKIKVVGPTRATKAEASEVRSLIKKLADLDAPDYGLSATLSGSSFAPIESSGHAGTLIFTNHGLKTNETFKKLVEFGPMALPFLLEALGDETPTKLETIRATLMGAAWLGHEIRGNPVNQAESEALKNANTKQEDDIDDEYIVRIGDVCFVAIGQITNRSYSAVRYQPTGCLVVNSPVKDKKLAAEVRAIWGKAPDAQNLLDSLLTDFYSRGVNSTGFQSGAAMRLAYYFPKESLDLIVERLKGLDVTRIDSEQKKDKNGIWSSFLIKSMIWSSDQRVRAELLDIFKRATDEGPIIACLPAIGNEHDDLVFATLTKRVEGRTSQDETKADDMGLLTLIGTRFPDRAEEVFRHYMDDDSLVRRQTMCRTLMGNFGNLSIKLLHPFFADKRDAPGSIILSPVKQQLRICDLAAYAISQSFPEIKFNLYGSHAELDQRIVGMGEKIANMKNDDE